MVITQMIIIIDWRAFGESKFATHTSFVCLFFTRTVTAARLMIFHRFTRSLVSANSRHIIQITFALSWYFSHLLGFDYISHLKTVPHTSTTNGQQICEITTNATRLSIGGKTNRWWNKKNNSKIIAVVHRVYI